MPIRPPFPFNKIKKPLYYRMTCPNCGFDKQYELAKDYTVSQDRDMVLWRGTECSVQI